MKRQAIFATEAGLQNRRRGSFVATVARVRQLAVIWSGERIRTLRPRPSRNVALTRLSHTRLRPSEGACGGAPCS